jgi:hypothetical protein
MREFIPGFSGKQRVNRPRVSLLLIFGSAVCFLSAAHLAAQGKPKVPTVDAGVGSCSADFVVRDGNHKPLYNASIDLNFRYGLFNLHKVSLQAFTDSNGQARFEGLPNAPKNPLAFDVRYGDRQKTQTDNPLYTCKAGYDVVLPWHSPSVPESKTGRGAIVGAHGRHAIG